MSRRSLEYQNRIVAAFISFARVIRNALKAGSRPLDEVGNDSPARWWSAVEKSMVETEAKEGNPVPAIGVVAK